MKVRLVPTQREFFDQHIEWTRQRGRVPAQHFMRASSYLWVEADGHGLILGLALYDSPAFVMAEEMVSKPGTPAWLVHLAVRLAASSWLIYCAANCKYPILHTSSRGLARLLQKMGFNLTGYATLTRVPLHEVKVAQKRPVEKPKKKPRARKGPRVKP